MNPYDAALQRVAQVISFSASRSLRVYHCDASVPDTPFPDESQLLPSLRIRRKDKDKPLKAVLVANKTDLPEQRHAVSIHAAREWAKMNGLDFCEASAKPPGKDYELPFLQVAQKFYKVHVSKSSNTMDLVTKY